MFTNEQIRTAMGELVKQKGEDHTSFGRYADPMTGQGACFLGALCQFMGRAIPIEGTRPQAILGEKNVTPEMAAAFAVAQYLNDSHFEWKYVLYGVDEALKGESVKGEALAGCPCGCDLGGRMGKIVSKVKAKRALDHMEAPKGPLLTGFASGGIIQPFSKITLKDMNLTGVVSFSTAMNEFTLSLNAAAGSLSQFSVSAPAQKDHALVA